MIVTASVSGFDELGQSLLKDSDAAKSAVYEVIERDLLFIVHRSQENVDGPRPVRLGILSGRLHSSLNENVTITTDASMMTGEMGTDVTSPQGFPYAKYWQGEVPQGKGTHIPWPRPFLPDAAEIGEKFLNDIKEAIGATL